MPDVFEARFKELGPLHDLLIRACPPDPTTGRKSIPRLAALLGVSPQAVFKMIRTDKISPVMAVKIVQASQKSEEPVSLDDLSPYVFK